MRIVCPGCRDPQHAVERGSRYFPFCSPQCQDRDLAGWVAERYRVDGGAPEFGSDQSEFGSDQGRSD
ncbi:MAG: DNA gyrase inhibitor YacG [Planctomycetota bacterium]